MGNSVIDFGWLPVHVDDSVIVSPGSCNLHSIVVNGLTTAGDATVYNGTDDTGDIIAVLHLDPTTSISVPPITFVYDCEMSDGIYIAYDQTLVADLTAMYR